MSSEIGSLFLAAVIGALASAVVFGCLWLWWLRNLHKQLHRLQRIVADKPLAPARSSRCEPHAVFANNLLTKKPELVARFKVKDGQQTVSVMESDGKRFLRVEGDLTWKQRLQMLRYLKAEGFMD